MTRWRADNTTGPSYRDHKDFCLPWEMSLVQCLLLHSVTNIEPTTLQKAQIRPRGNDIHTTTFRIINRSVKVGATNLKKKN